MTVQTLPVLIRREFWEHRVLWIAPLIVAVLYLLMCLIPGGIHVGSGISEVAGGSRLLLSVQLLFTTLLFALMSVVIFFYLADCLYAERKDRSILFWKSLPVSDSATVLSKLLVALVVVPLGLYLLSLVTNLLAFGILYARLHDSPVLGHATGWDTGTWLRLNGVLLLDVLILSLWYAPIAAYQMLMSAWVRSSVFVWTILPPLVLVVGERLFFGTWHLGGLLGERLGINLSGVMRDRPSLAGAPGTEGLLTKINAGGLLMTPDLWIGVAIAAALLFAAIRIRRYRDDS
jgi:ABC-2 type transport system permease protein